MEAPGLRGAEGPKPVWEGCVLCGSSSVTFRNGHNSGDGAKIRGCQGLRGGRDEQAEHRGFWGR